eukprot:m.337402 g.337402  ORF g.337402 m.337402 type:complete len:103 (+) comp18123_c0_seq1:127-435(+)
MARGLQKIQSQQNAKAKAEAKKGANSNLKKDAAAKNVQCKICMNTFLCTTREPELRGHAANKHPKHTFEQCFPNFDANAAVQAALEATGGAKGKQQQQKKKK